jgi:hypothetical protein
MDQKPGRTFELWLLALGLLFASLTGWLRLQFVITAWDFLIQTGIRPGPLYQAIMGAVWGLAGLVCAAGLLLRQRWAPPVTRITVLGLAGWYWLDLLALTRSPDTLDNWPYMLVVTLACIVYTLIVLALNSQKRFFGSQQ